MAKVTFSNQHNLFYQSLKAEVDAYFSSHNKKKTGDWRLYSKTLILIGTAVLLYCILMLLSLPVWLALLKVTH